MIVEICFDFEEHIHLCLHRATMDVEELQRAGYSTRYINNKVNLELECKKTLGIVKYIPPPKPPLPKEENKVTSVRRKKIKRQLNRIKTTIKESTGVITILSGWRAFTLEKIFFWPKLKGSCVEMKKTPTANHHLRFRTMAQHGRCNQAPLKA